MKKLLPFSFLAAVAVFALTSCGGGNPDAAAKGFYNAMAKSDYEGAKQYASKSSHLTIDGLKAASLLGNMLGGNSKPAASPDAKEVKCDAPNGDKTNCTVCCDAAGKSERYELIKEGGKWVVNYSVVNAVQDNLPVTH